MELLQKALQTMTKRQLEIYHEMRLFHKRMKKWPTIAFLARLMGVTNASISVTIARMVRDGHAKYLDEHQNGKTRRVAICED